MVLARLEDEEVKAPLEGERQDGVARPQASLVDDFTGGREHSQMPVRGQIVDARLIPVEA